MQDTDYTQTASGPAVGTLLDRSVGRLVPEHEEDRVRVLLEKAADALGLDRRFYVAGDGWWVWRYGEGGSYWNPWDDDRDAFGLLVALALELRQAYGSSHAGRQSLFWQTVRHGDDPRAASRHAAVQAAAWMADHMTPNAELTGQGGCTA